MFERLETSEDLFRWRLGAALKMEHVVVGVLDHDVEAARQLTVREILRDHQLETQEHATRIEQAFDLMGWDVGESPCPAIEGIEKQTKAELKKSDDVFVDATILAGTAATEHHEIATYETLIIHATALGRGDVVPLLRATLDEETQALRKAQFAMQELATRQPAVASAAV